MWHNYRSDVGPLLFKHVRCCNTKSTYFQGRNEGWVEPYTPTSDKVVEVYRAVLSQVESLGQHRSSCHFDGKL